MQNCFLTTEMLADFVEQRLTSTVLHRVEAHLESGCRECRERIEWLRTTAPALSAVIAEPEISAPDHVLRKARLIAREMQPGMAAQVRSFVLGLVFDSFRKAAPLAARGAALPSRLRVFEEGPYGIELWDEQNGGTGYIIARAYEPADRSPLTVESAALTSKTGKELVGTDVDGEQHFSSVEAGVYELTIRLAQGDIVSANVEFQYTA